MQTSVQSSSHLCRDICTAYCKGFSNSWQAEAGTDPAHRFHGSGRNAVDPDLVLAELRCGDLGHPDDSEFCDGIRGVDAWVAAQPSDLRSIRSTSSDSHVMS